MSLSVAERLAIYVAIVAVFVSAISAAFAGWQTLLLREARSAALDTELAVRKIETCANIYSASQFRFQRQLEALHVLSGGYDDLPLSGRAALVDHYLSQIDEPEKFQARMLERTASLALLFPDNLQSMNELFTSIGVWEYSVQSYTFWFKSFAENKGQTANQFSDSLLSTYVIIVPVANEPTILDEIPTGVFMSLVTTPLDELVTILDPSDLESWTSIVLLSDSVESKRIIAPSQLSNHVDYMSNGIEEFWELCQNANSTGS